ncbi:hypothetical protein CPB84DRAFT_1514783 [Gymnopilus junonius]|uniref:Uncharacterized protein n=1 Tax=Gymnopilus junonius TaxID=109634 RepID=A0A9P5NZQ7_GYMJU|nr:hypothetical protein CPB84DRAFT_1514783 [Gymnopilus junonius]
MLSGKQLFDRIRNNDQIPLKNISLNSTLPSIHGDAHYCFKKHMHLLQSSLSTQCRCKTIINEVILCKTCRIFLLMASQDRSSLSLNTSSAVVSIRQESSSPTDTGLRQLSSFETAQVKCSRPQVRSLQSTQDILQHKHTMSAIIFFLKKCHC